MAIDSDLGIIDPYRATDNFFKKVTLSRNGNKVKTFDMMWGRNEVSVLWANKHDNYIYSMSMPQSVLKFEFVFKKMANEPNAISLVGLSREIRSAGRASVLRSSD